MGASSRYNSDTRLSDNELAKREAEGNMRTIQGYQKKGLLEILDRETTHYNTVNYQQTKPPTTPGQKGSGS